MSNTTTKRTYVTNSKRQKIIQYFRENPYARPVDVAKEFTYSYGATYTCKKLAAGTPPEVKVVNRTNGTFKNGTGWVAGASVTSDPDDFTWHNDVQEVAPAPEPLKHSVPLSPWADYGLWMDRDSFKGYLRGRAVEHLTNGDKLSVEEALRCVTKLSELTD